MSKKKKMRKVRRRPGIILFNATRRSHRRRSKKNPISHLPLGASPGKPSDDMQYNAALMAGIVAFASLAPQSFWDKLEKMQREKQDG